MKKFLDALASLLAAVWTRLRGWIPVIGGLTLIVVLVLWQGGAFRSGQIPPGETVQPKPPPPAGKPVALAMTEIPMVYKAVGTVRSRTQVELSPRIVARVLDVKVRSGDRIKKDDVLVRLDDAELVTGVRQAEEQGKAANAAVLAADERITQARSAAGQAQSELERMQKLREGGASTPQALDAAVAAARQSRAGLAAAEQARQAAVAGAAGADQARVQAETMLGHATIASPIDGVVSERFADPGDLASPGAILLKIFDPARLMLEVPVRESLATRIKVGDKVPFVVGSLNRTLAGEVKEIVPAVDPGSRTFIAKICIGEDKELMPGMCGTLELPLGSRKALLVPAAAVIRSGQLEYVNAIVAERPLRLFVRTIPATAGQREVVSGLEAGTTILVPEEAAMK
jgi:RND family efflux transporter MFP subunit